MNEYNFGQCRICHKDKALKDGVCAECKTDTGLPEGFEELFGGFNGKTEERI